MNLAPIWLSHHREEQLKRCIRVRGLHICRRCLVLWPLTFALIGALIVLRAPFDLPADRWLPGLLALPVAEFIAVSLGWIRYSPARLYLFSPLLAIALSRLFHRYMLQPLDAWTWTMLLLAFLPSMAAVLWASVKRGSGRSVL